MFNWLHKLSWEVEFARTQEVVSSLVKFVCIIPLVDHLELVMFD